jgi:hypothetical protein
LHGERRLIFTSEQQSSVYNWILALQDQIPRPQGRRDEDEAPANETKINIPNL